MKPIRIWLLGLGLIVLGFVYDVLFAGIPYQDPTPEIESRFLLHKSVAATIGWLGLAVSSVGLVLGVRRRLRKPTEE